TGLVGVLTGPDVAFRWSLYLLVSLWPISVYVSAPMFGAGGGACGSSATWGTAWGVWPRLWVLRPLPLAWDLSWRAIRDGRGYLPAVLLTALTVALHFETGYLALSVLLVWALVSGRPLLVGARRAAVALAGALLATAWVTVPLLLQRN